MSLADRLWGQDSRPCKLADVQEDLKIVIQDLVKVSPNIRIFLFGSFAKKTATQTSDLDLAVILTDQMDKKSFRKEFYSRRTRIHIPIDFIFRNESEFQSSRADYPVDDEIKGVGIELYPQWKFYDEV